MKTQTLQGPSVDEVYLMVRQDPEKAVAVYARKMYEQEDFVAILYSLTPTEIVAREQHSFAAGTRKQNKISALNFCRRATGETPVSIEPENFVPEGRFMVALEKVLRENYNQSSD